MPVGFAIVIAAILSTTVAVGRATDKDAAVITAAMQHFLTQKDALFFGDQEQKKVVLVRKETLGPAPISLSDAQLDVDTETEKWTVPAEAAENLRRRNAKEVSLRDLKFGNGIQFLDAKKDDLALLLLKGDQYKDVKAYVFMWLPGYTRDGATAVVRFSFGPSPHGSTATYLLVKVDGAWKVKKYSFAHYA